MGTDSTDRENGCYALITQELRVTITQKPSCSEWLLQISLTFVKQRRQDQFVVRHGETQNAVSGPQSHQENRESRRRRGDTGAALDVLQSIGETGETSSDVALFSRSADWD